eukprot:3923579-Lingulodinium_polyedra.AAC.1
MACGFYGILRTGEVLSLTRGDLAIRGSLVHIELGWTKGGQRKGCTEASFFEEPSLAPFVRKCTA